MTHITKPRHNFPSLTNPLMHIT